MWIPEARWRDDDGEFGRALAWIERRRSFFDARRPIVLARAPGRLDLMGGIADYSYSTCGLGSDGTDRLVDLVRAAGPAAGLYGAKITGGGSGGTVAVLAASGMRASVDDIAARYRRESGREPQLFAGSSPGSRSHGVRRLLPASN